MALVITGLTTLVAVLAAAVHHARLRGYRAARRRLTTHELFVEQMTMQAATHAELGDAFAQYYLDALQTLRKDLTP